MKKEKQNTTVWAIVLNTFLFIIKLFVGIMSNSLALVSDAFNSLSDIVTSTVIFFSVHFSAKEADEGHPYGYRRVQPLAAFFVAILTGVLGFELIKAASLELFTPDIIVFVSLFTVLVPIITIIIKGGMAFYYLKEGERRNSPAYKAIGIDARNDVLVSITVLIAVIGSYYGIIYLDGIVALLISAFIIYQGYKLAVENMDYLIGKSPPKEEIEQIRREALSIKGVMGVNDIKAHYVGNYIHIEVHIEVHRLMSTEKSHMISKEVEKIIERIPNVDKAFVHVDPR